MVEAGVFVHIEDLANPPDIGVAAVPIERLLDIGFNKVGKADDSVGETT